MLDILTNEFFNSFIGIYRPYIKLTQPILDQHQIHTGQWLVLRDIANYQPTTRKLIKVLLDNGWVMTKTGVDKREKLLSLTDKGQSLFETINKKVTVIQQDIIKKTGLTDEQVFDITNAMSQIHEAMIKEEQ
ncbi:MarR family winged helix-turn-helix transcriptional regulator [Staphylococcus epidermidis]|uniref:MarR family winged helix-turn-helix transcriptional regulator n=1 Tax=Staphylococcus epidermidis TaxID=1282 RepID=UPI0036D40C03